MEKNYGPTILRLSLATLFLYTGINKLMSPSGITGILQGLGFPAATALGWIVLLSEVIFGLALLTGWKVKYAVWPLIIILTMAILFVAMPSGDWINVLFHIVGIAALISLFLTGPGKLAVDK
ncbi:DoxX family protein [Candidatus Pacearchaeota archaeon]|nr:DoxX family protein [Candidatus Pacearchaeota archaeon]